MQTSESSSGTETPPVSQIESSRKVLQDQIAATEAQLRGLRLELADLEEREHVRGLEHEREDGPKTCISAAEVKADSGQGHGLGLDGADDKHNHDHDDEDGGHATSSRTSRWPLLQDEYRRYGRQMIVDQIGLDGQLKLRASSVLIVGAGGLGCPAALYLAGAGVGTLGLVDGDVVESSNLHRQVLHRTPNTGKFKVDSAMEYLRELNPHPRYIPFRTRLTPQEAPDIFAPFDIILDCTDNPATRYLISDTAVLLGKPLVSASALRTDGQLMVLNYPARPPGDETGGPCYRCMFPRPPPADNVVSCADGGILGPVVGMMGVMQALETIRAITTPEPAEPHTSSPIVPSLHLFSAYSTPPFRSIRLRRRRAGCVSCSAKASITLESLQSGSMDYVQFCGSLNAASLLRADERVTAEEYAKAYNAPPSQRQTLIDVRERVQYHICALQNSVNIPVSELQSLSRTLASQTQNPADDGSKAARPLWAESLHSLPESDPIHVVCRQGNDSQAAVQVLKELGVDREGKRFVGDIKGGLNAWRQDVDPEFPDY